MKLKVEVTQEDIDEGVQGCPTGCPIALAVKRACSLPKATVMVSDKIFIIPWDNSERQTLSLPANGAEIVHNYDAIGVMSPFDFEIEIAS